MTRQHPNSTVLIATTIGLLLALGGLSCARKDVDTAAETAPYSADSMAGAKSGDAGVLAFLMTANSAELADAKVAGTQATATGVKEFAQSMTNEHQALQDRLTAFVQSAGIQPQDDALSRELATASDSARQTVQALHGAAFDRAWMDHAVQAHQSLLDALDQRLIPGAVDARVKELFTSVRSAVAMHLATAKQVRAGLGG